MKATKKLPDGYRQHASHDLSKSKTAIGGAIVLGVFLLIMVGWLLVKFAWFLRSSALGDISFCKILDITSDGEFFIVFPIIDILFALVLVLSIHEMVHGVFYWVFAGQRPTIGVKRLIVYTTAPPDYYFPRNQYLIIGVAPLVLLSLVGMLLMMVIPINAMCTLNLFLAFNAAGSAGDLMMVFRLLSSAPESLMQDHKTGVVVYGPEKSQNAS